MLLKYPAVLSTEMGANVHSKKWMFVVLGIILALTVTGCTACGWSHNATITVCKKTSDKVLAADGRWYELRDDTTHKDRLREGRVFEIEAKELFETEGEDKVEISRVFREKDETPEFCP